MNKEDKLKKEFENEFCLKEYPSGKNVDVIFPDTSPEDIFDWIQQHYISKDKVKGLKMEEWIEGTKFGNKNECAIANIVVDEINNKIDEVLK